MLNIGQVKEKISGGALDKFVIPISVVFLMVYFLIGIGIIPFNLITYGVVALITLIFVAYIFHRVGS